MASNAGRRNPANNVDDDTIRIRERRRQAIELRRANVTYEQIALTLGYAHRGKAYEDVHIALDQITKQPAEELLAEELDRLDALIMGLWSKARVGDVHAVDRVLRIMERRARYRGLDAPTRQVITVIPEDAFDAEIRRLEQIMADRDEAARADAEPT